MPTNGERLADALQSVYSVAQDNIIQTDQISRAHRELLITAGWLEQVIRGWYFVTNPKYPPGSTIPWYSSYWAFISRYLESRFGDSYCLSPEASLKLHAQNQVIPPQIVVAVGAKENNLLKIPHGCSILMWHSDSLPTRRKIGGIQVMELPLAICKVSEPFYHNYPEDAEIALGMIGDASELLHSLLDNSNVVVAGRLVGAYEFTGRKRIAAGIKSAMEAAGRTVRVSNPFNRTEPMLTNVRSRIKSPHQARIKGLWHRMRTDVLSAFVDIKPRPMSAEEYLADVEARYVADAYNSLSIEGYRVDTELIERVRSGEWNPDHNEVDGESRNALAARGYYLTFQAVKHSIGRIFDGESAADVTEEDFQEWYREMFSPMVIAGILQASQLAGYRNIPVFLNGSRYIPPSPDAVLDCMETFFELLHDEPEPIVRAVLGHYVFVYIHPYTDGNGRIGRFQLNTGFAAGNYPWTVIRNDRRKDYLAALEIASTEGDIAPFARFIVEEMKAL